jgi:hypothetical protein
VNLDVPFILLNDGLQPSDGDSQLHQQMVYTEQVNSSFYAIYFRGANLQEPFAVLHRF